jgi:hypothetical protein
MGFTVMAENLIDPTGSIGTLRDGMKKSEAKRQRTMKRKE